MKVCEKADEETKNEAGVKAEEEVMEDEKQGGF